MRPEYPVGKIITQLLVVGRYPTKKRENVKLALAFLFSIPVKSKVDCDLLGGIFTH